VVEFHPRATGDTGVSGVPRRPVFRLCVYSTLNAPRSIVLLVQTNDSLNGKSINLDGGSIAPSANEKFRSFSFSSKPPFRGEGEGGSYPIVESRPGWLLESLLEGTTRRSGILQQLGGLYRSGEIHRYLIQL